MASVRLLPEEMLLRDRRAPRSRVAVLSAEHYSERLVELLLAGLGEFHLDLRAKSLLLKPNLVKYIAGVEVNTILFLWVQPPRHFSSWARSAS